ncbi:MAG: cobalt ECF transporter T component CbiQ [Thermomicrobiaceae bacterium]|nr:cobalt ECF transporter T component CbiQ [Thermomicrobiaceae bacterium]
MASVSGARAARGRRGRPDFVAKTVVGVAEAIERTVYTEEYARRAGLLQGVDPRAKLVLFALAVLVAGLSRGLPVLAALYAVTVLLGLLSRLPPAFLLKRVLLGIPLFAGIVALPALLMIPGAPLLDLGRLGPVHLAVSANALWSVATFVLRVTTSVSLAVLLVVTTRWADLLKALRVIGVPEVFIVVLGMTYRYIFLFLRAVENLFLARASRTVGEASDRERRQWIGASAGTLLSKSMRTSNEVYQAMVARGFTGNVRTLTDFAMRDEDWLFVACGVGLLALALILDSRL